MKIDFHKGAALVATVVLMVALDGVTPVAASNLPGGSWRDSCRNGVVYRGTLSAECRRTNGKYRNTSARIDDCARFGNRDGQLFCEAAAGGSEWHGSYRKTCINERVDKKGHLKADCLTTSGRYRKSEIKPGNCPDRRAGNNDGRLVCEESGFGGSGGSGGSNIHWRGSFEGSCRDISTDSAGNLRASCQNTSGRWERAYLAAYSCPSHRAGNHNGRLVCEQ